MTEDAPRDSNAEVSFVVEVPRSGAVAHDAEAVGQLQ
jgi:hypothetical protein